MPSSKPPLTDKFCIKMSLPHPDFSWTSNETHLCYENETTKLTFCGFRDKNDCDEKGLLLPLVLEVTWPREARAVLYFVGLIYSFLGVSIVADVFMCAIEKITSKTKTIHIAGASDDNTGESLWQQ